MGIKNMLKEYFVLFFPPEVERIDSIIIHSLAFHHFSRNVNFILKDISFSSTILWEKKELEKGNAL